MGRHRARARAGSCSSRASRAASADAWRPGVGLALVAALGFGLFVVGLGEAAQESASWAVATARLSSVTALLLALAWTRTVPRVSRRLVPLVLAVGVFDTGANALIAVATTHGSIGIVAVLSALYPITTILLARAVLHERLGADADGGWADRARRRCADRRRLSRAQTLKRMLSTSPSWTT